MTPETQLAGHRKEIDAIDKKLGDVVARLQDLTVVIFDDIIIHGSLQAIRLAHELRTSGRSVSSPWVA